MSWETKRDLVKEKEWYPPSCKEHVEILAKFCGNKGQHEFDLLSVLNDIKYRAVHKEGSGIIRGYKFNIVQPISDLKLNINDSEAKCGRRTINFTDVVKIERVGEIPWEYRYVKE